MRTSSARETARRADVIIHIIAGRGPGSRIPHIRFQIAQCPQCRSHRFVLPCHYYSIRIYHYHRCTFVIMWHHGMIGALLRWERICLQALGVPWFSAVESSPDEACADDEAIPLQNLEESSANAKCTKRSRGLAVIIFFLSCQFGYYTLHYLFPTANEDKAMEKITKDPAYKAASYLIFTLDCFNNLLFLSFPFGGPMHRALGYGDMSGQRDQTNTRSPPNDPVQMRTCLLLQHPGARTTFFIVVFCFALYMMGELLFYLNSFPAFFQKILYVACTAGAMILMYGALALVMFSFQALFARLEHLEAAVDEALQQSSQTANYHTFSLTPANNGDNTSSTFDPQTAVLEWSTEYTDIRHHLHDISLAMGRRLLLALLFYICEVSTQLAGFHALEDELPIAKAANVFMFDFANTVMLVTTLFSIASIVTKCAHRIGPKVAVLAIRHPGVPMQCLSMALMQAPVKFHVGMFEIGPEYAMATALWFFALILLVFGYSMPGE